MTGLAPIFPVVILLLVVAITHTVNGADDGWILCVHLDALAQLGDMLIQRSAVGHVIQTPAPVEERVTRNDGSPVFMKKTEDLDIPEAQFDRCSTPTRPKLGRKHVEVT